MIPIYFGGHAPLHPRKAAMEIDIDAMKNSEGEPLTPEERELVQGWLATGKVNYESLPGYKKNRMCPKCGNDKMRTIYHNGQAPDCFEQSGGREHILRVCKRCGYSHNEKPLSEEEFSA